MNDEVLRRGMQLQFKEGLSANAISFVRSAFEASQEFVPRRKTNSAAFSKHPAMRFAVNASANTH